MKLPSHPLVPIALALAVTVAGHFAMELVAVGLPLQGRYYAPDPVPSMTSVGSDLQIILRAVEGWRGGITDYDAIRAWAEAHDPWGRVYGPYPPLVLWLALPFSGLADLDVLRLWGLLFVLAYPAALVLLLRRAHPSLDAWGAATGVLMLFALSASTLLELERGNFNWVVATLYALSLALLARSRDLAGGALLGLAIAVKAYPVVFLPFLAIHRRWRALAGAAAAMAAVVAVTGPTANLRWLAALVERRTDWLEVCSWNTSAANAIAWAFPTLGAAAASRAGIAVWGVLVAAALAATLAAGRAGRLGDPARTGALVIPLMLIVPATSWSYTLFMLLPMLPVLARVWRDDPASRGLAAVAAGLIGLVQAPLTAWVLRGGPGLLVPLCSISLLAIAVIAVRLLHLGDPAEPRTP